MIQAALKPFISETEYLEGEELTECASEYLDGRVLPLEAATDLHGEIAGAIGCALHQHLRGKKCRPWIGNMRLRLSFPRRVHYIPDVFVACDDPPRDPRFREEPLAIWEVLSKSTEATDRREKRSAYATLPTLRYYSLVRQDRLEVTVVRRSGFGWEELVFDQPEQLVEVLELGFKMSLADIYADSGVGK